MQKNIYNKIGLNYNNTRQADERIVGCIIKWLPCAIIDEFILPGDLKDGFFYSAWKCPKKYLSSDFITQLNDSGYLLY